MPVIPDVMRHAREAQNMSRGDLSLMTSISLEKIQRMETGEQVNLRIDEVLVLCGVLGVRLGDVVSHPDRQGQPWGVGAHLHP